MYGAEQSLLHVVRRLDPGEWEPAFVVAREGDLAAAIRREGWPIHYFDLEPGFEGAFGLSRLIRALRPDLVHLNLHFAWPTVSLACLLAGTPLVVHVRNMIAGRPGGRWHRWLFRRAAAIISISAAVRVRLLECGLASPGMAGRIEVIADGRDFSRAVPGDRSRLRTELGIAPETPLIGMVARLEPMKGQDVFLGAAREVARQIPEARFVLVGDVMNEAHRKYRTKLDRLAAEPPLAGRVTFLGYRNDIPHVLAALDCFVHSSHRGAFVSVLIEAMAAGVPIVASDVDGIPECVGRDGAGHLVSPVEPAAFARAIIDVVTNPAAAASMAEAGRSRALTRFDIGPLADSTAAVFRRALQRARE